MLNIKILKSTGVLIVIILLMAIIYRCKNHKIESDYYKPVVVATHTNGEQFVGSRTCIECHAELYNTHIKTPHFKTSAIADSANIKGSFENGTNILDLKQVAFRMQTDKNSFYQHTQVKNRTIAIDSAKFDVVIGSGIRGQSYGTWQDSALFQLQTSYYTPTNSWVNSPGYPMYYDEPRPIRDACLKCHTTFAKNVEMPGQGNQYSKNEIIYGIDCERCHRPAAKHVAYHKANPEERNAKFMLNIKSLSRQQRLDVCAQCHSGKRELLLKGNSFSFVTGENLTDYSRNADQVSNNATLDVHGNQYGLLIESECFKNSESFDCNTCHNSHKKERGLTQNFNQKCNSCHNEKDANCGANDAVLAKMGNNCIACHMPLIASKSMTVQLSEKDSLETSFYIRTHLIGVYKEDEIN